MTAPLIGLIGKKRAGKDTFAAALIRDHGFRRFAFADPMRDGLLELDPLVRIEVGEIGLLRPEFNPRPGGTYYVERLTGLIELVGWERAKGVGEVRRLLQNYGNGIRNAAGLNVWVDGLMAQVAEAREPEECHPDCDECAMGGCQWGESWTPVVITDVRYPNEAEAVKEAGGLLVRITRPGLVSVDTHISEVALDDWPVDATAINDRGIDYLEAQARCLVGARFPH